MPSMHRRFPIYSRLLRLYPPTYRTYYDQSLQTLADMLDGTPSRTGKATVWIRVAIDWPISLMSQQSNYIGGIMMHDMPRFVKRNAIAAGLMLIPFTFAVIMNTFDQALYHQTLYQSWGWSMPVLMVWALWLPALAVVLSGISLVYYIVQRTRDTKQTVRRVVLQAQYFWPLLAAFCASLFLLAMLFGHDSVHCVTGNPIHELYRWRETLLCIQHG